MEEAFEKPRSSGSCFKYFLLLINAGLVTVLVLGLEYSHTPRPHPMAAIFDGPEHQALLTSIASSEQKVTVRGEANSGIFEFMIEYANWRAEQGMKVMLKELNDDLFSNFLEMCQDISASIFGSVGLGAVHQPEWIVLVRRRDFYEDIIQELERKNPNARIVVAISKNAPLQGFANIEFVPVAAAQVKEAILKNSQFSEKRAEIMARFYWDISQLLTDTNHSPLDIPTILGKYYLDTGSLNEEDRAILQKICQQGKHKGTQILVGEEKERMRSLGLHPFRKLTYWAHHKHRLNYELANQVMCLPEIVPGSLYRMSHDKQYAQEQRKKLLEKSMASRKPTNFTIPHNLEL